MLEYMERNGDIKSRKQIINAETVTSGEGGITSVGLHFHICKMG
jgi:hypothetical protein